MQLVFLCYSSSPWIAASTQSSTSFLHIHSMSHLKCKVLCIVINFFAFWSICLGSTIIIIIIIIIFIIIIIIFFLHLFFDIITLIMGRMKNGQHVYKQ